MSRKKSAYPLLEGVEITDLAAEGKSLGRVGDRVVFVPMTVPGDVVDVQITRMRHRYLEGRAVRFLTRSPRRTEPVCAHFGVCGGCSWQSLPYPEQLAFKTTQVHEQLRRIGGIELPDIRPIIPSARTIAYRNKLEFTFAPRRWMTREEIDSGRPIEPEPALGFHIPGMFDRVLDIDRCWLQDEPSNAIRGEIRRFAVEHGYPFYDARTHEGLLRTLQIRCTSLGEWMVVVVFGQEDTPRIEALMEHIAASFPQITSLMYVVNTKWNDALGDQNPRLWSGRDHIEEQMEGLRFRIGPKSFYQTNSEQAYALYKAVRELAALTSEEVLYDLYTGTGTIANFCASRCRLVVGVEYVEEAIEDARENARRNGIGNARFVAGDMKRVLTPEFVARNGRPDVVILDPPRAGVDPQVLDVLLEAKPDRMVYVSCNPATQARDLQQLDAWYRVEAVQPVDMFPHTHHVENVVQLVRRAEAKGPQTD